MVEAQQELPLDGIDKAVGEWHRVYAQLSAARERLRRGGGGAIPLELRREVQRLEGSEERALRAVRDALTWARRQGMRAPDRPSWADTEPA